ncbi:MAG: phosphonate ABC transporter, permease protein PhnE [Bacillati bacterium ANGP1]|uniref:Phosphonate ABC transporter, permease protein PhnE n=1 Tax=Candidatus Segetimicrobium genomatis TaxID=2569760 RepID=A0A537J291_9BACT|nr:MAG: phosphonate ABC transporter, permease protein PhnE [Terrabacteria group bacterium ANGP1]
MAAEDPGPEPARGPPAVWYRSWRFYLVLVLVVWAYAYGWRVTQINLGELWRGASLIEPFARSLASPDVVTRELHIQQATAPFYYGGATPPPAAGGTGSARLTLSRSTGSIGDRVAKALLRFSELPPGLDALKSALEIEALADYPLLVTKYKINVPSLSGPLRPSRTLLVVLDRMVETVFLALMGTTMGVLFAVPLSFLGAKNLVGHLPAGTLVYAATRAFFNITRSIEALVLAILFTVWVGLGPFAGVLALGVHSIASLGKLYSEAIESIDAGPIEAITATGASAVQVVRYAVVPQIVPQFIAFTIYRWDINVRFSTVIGFVGGGGIGFVLQQYINLLQWRQAATALWMIAVVVAALDYASAVVRERIV